MKPGEAVLRKLTRAENQHNHGRGVAYQIGNVEIVIEYDRDEDEGQFIDVKSIIAKRPGRGDGTKALGTLTKLADEHGAVLSLYARAMDQRPRTTKRYIAWYERHGFQLEGENPFKAVVSNEIDEDHIGADMWRRPQSNHQRKEA